MSEADPIPVEERTVAPGGEPAVPPERGLTPVEPAPIAARQEPAAPAVRSLGWWPALRDDLAPLVPPVRRAVTVMAVAAAADWAVRAAGRRLVAGRVPVIAPPLPARRRSETIIVERVIIHRS